MQKRFSFNLRSLQYFTNCFSMAFWSVACSLDSVALNLSNTEMQTSHSPAFREKTSGAHEIRTRGTITGMKVFMAVVGIISKTMNTKISCRSESSNISLVVLDSGREPQVP